MEIGVRSSSRGAACCEDGAAESARFAIGGEMVEGCGVVVGECSGGWHRLASTMLAGVSGFLSGVLDGVKTPIFVVRFGVSC